MTTASTLSKVPGAMYTTRSPQGFNPWMYNDKKATTTTVRTTTPSSFFGSVKLSSKGDGSDVKKVALPVGMLGTPSPNFKDFNFKKFVEEMKKKRPMGGRINLKEDTQSTNSVKQSILKPRLQTPALTFTRNRQTTKSPADMKNILNSFKNTPSLTDVVNKLKNQKAPSMDDIVNSLKERKTFAAVPAVPDQSSEERFTTESISVKNKFEPLPAVPSSDLTKHQDNPFPAFQHFPSTTTEQVSTQRKPKSLSFETRNRNDDIERSLALQKLKDLLMPKSKATMNEELNSPSEGDGSEIKKVPLPVGMLGTPSPNFEDSNFKKFVEIQDLKTLMNSNPDRYKTPFSPSTQRTFEDLKTTTTTTRPKLPRGTVRSEIMKIIQDQKSTTTSKSDLFELLQLSTDQTTISPVHTTSRAEVLALLKEFLQSVKPDTSTPSTPRIASTTTLRSTSTTRETTTVKSERLFKSPSLRFEDPPALAQPRLNIDLTTAGPPMYHHLMTTASPVNPRSPFPNMEPPQHDVLTSNIYLPDPVNTVIQTSTVHPLSPFQHLEPPGPAESGSLEFLSENIFPTPGGEPFITDSFPNRAVPRSYSGGSMLPYDPARPHLPPQNPTEKPGQFRVFLGQKEVTRAPRNFADKSSLKIHPVPRTRMTAPESRRPGLDRRLVMDGPTEASLTPLELLARGTVPTLPHDKTFFGTPRSRLKESQSPLEQLSAKLKFENFSKDKPVDRTRFQQSPGQHRTPSPQIRLPPGVHFDFNSLPGVKTGTTAVGLVEHRDHSQPLFHVPIFTTPIPKNGQFINLKPNPIQSLKRGLQRITSSITEKVKLPRLPSPAEGLQRLKRIFGGNVGAAQEVRDIQITPAPRHMATRRLDTFSRYTTFGNNGGRSFISSPLVLLLCIVINLIIFKP